MKLRVSLNEARLIHKYVRKGLDFPISKKFNMHFVKLPKPLIEKVHNHALLLGYKVSATSFSVDTYAKPITIQKNNG